MVALGLVVGSIVAIGLLLGVSAFFSSSEIAIFSLPPAWVESQAATGSARATALAELCGDSHRLLVTILVGNNVVNIAISSITTVLFVAYLPPTAAAVGATLTASSLVLVAGEIVPKSYGLGHAREWSLRVARPLAAVQTVLYPLVVVFEVLTRGLSDLLDGDPNLETPYEGVADEDREPASVELAGRGDG